MISASAPGKIILFGEHAVVYDQPAIAVPVTQVSATAQIEPAPAGDGLTLVATDLDRRVTLAQAPPDDPLALIAQETLDHLGQRPPDAVLTIRSTIPIASGLGSGAAVSTAIVRALARFFGQRLSPAETSQLVYQAEKVHHGTPSGIDNTVIACGHPVYFMREKALETFAVGTAFPFLIADSGVPSPTREVVGAVRAGWETTPNRYDRLFEQVGTVVNSARQALEAGEIDTVGTLMTRNQTLLEEMGVSSPALDKLVAAALAAGAMGAKLSGAGRGGNVIALVGPGTSRVVEDALATAGAQNIIPTTVE
jgi:mevalonate kinase